MSEVREQREIGGHPTGLEETELPDSQVRRDLQDPRPVLEQGVEVKLRLESVDVSRRRSPDSRPEPVIHGSRGPVFPSFVGKHRTAGPCPGGRVCESTSYRPHLCAQVWF